jgi:hypothetical protein
MTTSHRKRQNNIFSFVKSPDLYQKMIFESYTLMCTTRTLPVFPTVIHIKYHGHLEHVYMSPVCLFEGRDMKRQKCLKWSFLESYKKPTFAQHAIERDIYERRCSCRALTHNNRDESSDDSFRKQ